MRRVVVFLVAVMVAALAMVGGTLPANAEVNPYITEGTHTVNGRQWRTTCEPYSQTKRCRAEIWSTQVRQINGRFVSKNQWAFNNLTYLTSPRALWKGNPLGFRNRWTATDGRRWYTQCDTPATGRNGCRSYAESRVIEATKKGGVWTYRWVTKYLFNNIVNFTSQPRDGVACADLVAGMTLAEQVGQLYMVAVSTRGLDAATSRAITETHTGSVVLLRNSTAGAAAIMAVTDDVAALGNDAMPVLIAVDQEGGTVQRLKGPGFSNIPTAVNQAALPKGKLRVAAQGWGEELAAVGVHYNLAPVADVVPKDKQSSNAPIGALKRNYGNDRDVAARSVAEFTDGMGAAGIATSLKHFPGLGKVTTNTDFGAATDTDVVPGDKDWVVFTAGIDAGASSVMMSSAVFKNLDPDNEGVFSTIIIRDMLRGGLGFDKVVIADDLGAAAAVAGIPAAQRGTRFIQAGGDLAINANPAHLKAMVANTLAAAEANEGFASRVAESAARVLELKAEAGLLKCQR